MKLYKSKGKRIFEILHWPSELPSNQHRPTGPFGWHKWCSLAQPSKGQCTISKILSSLVFFLFIEQNIFFPEICFAYTISEPKIHSVKMWRREKKIHLKKLFTVARKRLWPVLKESHIGRDPRRDRPRSSLRVGCSLRFEHRVELSCYPRSPPMKFAPAEFECSPVAVEWN